MRASHVYAMLTREMIQHITSEYTIASVAGGRMDIAVATAALMDAVMEEEAARLAEDVRQAYGPVAAYRNGYRIRHLQTQYGDLTLHVPQFRYIPFRTQLFQPYCRMSRDVEDLVVAAVRDGVSTRKVDDLVKTLGISGMSASTVSRICARYKETIRMFLSRPLLDAVPYVWADATYVSVRVRGTYVQRPLMIALGVNARGERTVLGAELAYRESEESWLMFFRRLAERGLSGVRLVITDLRCGVRAAALQSFGGASWQVCTVHLLRCAAEQMRKSDARSLRPAISRALHTGSIGYDGLIEQFRALRLDAAAMLMQEYRADALAYRTFPREHWKALYTTNPLENVNSVLKRRLRAAGPFPSDESVMRLAGSLLMRLEATVFAGKTYLHGMQEVVSGDEETRDIRDAGGAENGCNGTFASHMASRDGTWMELFS